MNANCENCGAAVLVVLDDQEKIELRFIGADSSGRAIYAVDVVAARPIDRHRAQPKGLRR